MKMNEMNLKAFRNDFTEAVKILEVKYGMKLTLGNIKYSEYEFSSKLEAKAECEAASIATTGRLDSFADAYRIPRNGRFTESWYKTSNGKTFVPTDIEIKNHKYPVIARCREDGKSYKLSVEQLCRATVL